MPMNLVFVLKWVKSVIGCSLYIFHLSVHRQLLLRTILVPGKVIKPSKKEVEVKYKLVCNAPSLCYDSCDITELNAC